MLTLNIPKAFNVVKAPTYSETTLVELESMSKQIDNLIVAYDQIVKHPQDNSLVSFIKTSSVLFGLEGLEPTLENMFKTAWDRIKEFFTKLYNYIKGWFAKNDEAQIKNLVEENKALLAKAKSGKIKTESLIALEQLNAQVCILNSKIDHNAQTLMVPNLSFVSEFIHLGHIEKITIDDVSQSVQKFEAWLKENDPKQEYVKYTPNGVIYQNKIHEAIGTIRSQDLAISANKFIVCSDVEDAIKTHQDNYIEILNKFTLSGIQKQLGEFSNNVSSLKQSDTENAKGLLIVGKFIHGAVANVTFLTNIVKASLQAINRKLKEINNEEVAA
jgi:hypothetical protein